MPRSPYLVLMFCEMFLCLRIPMHTYFPESRFKKWENNLRKIRHNVVFLTVYRHCCFKFYRFKMSQLICRQRRTDMKSTVWTSLVTETLVSKLSTSLLKNGNVSHHLPLVFFFVGKVFKNTHVKLFRRFGKFWSKKENKDDQYG